MDSTKGSCSILVQRRRDGNYSVGIAIKNVPVRRSPCGKLFVLLDVNQQIPVAIDCDGVHLKPWLILKIFRKLTTKDRRTIDRVKKLKPLEGVII